MQRILVIFFLSVLMFNCGSKKSVVKRSERSSKPESEVVKEKPATKTYANATERYIDTYKDIAQNEMRLYDIPASITIAQGILESGSGKGTLSVKANNHFGIKCHGWTGKKIYHDDDKAQECFRKYKDAKYSFRDHSLFLKDRKRYAKLFKLKKKDYKGWARGLKAAGYATDRKYPQKLISLIERYKLYQLDQDVLGDTYEIYQKPPKNEGITYIVTKGDTLYSISKKYNITVKELQNINGLKDNALSIGQELQVKPINN